MRCVVSCLLLLCLTPWVTVAEVSWFLHLSDLHFSEVATDRSSDLNTLIRDFFPFFNFSGVLLTGDLVHGKVPHSRRSQQRPKEWEQYKEMVQIAHDALGTSPSTFVDIRGNHDVFDMGVRNGEGDLYHTSGVQGKAWASEHILIHPFFATTACPVYSLVGVDTSPEIGLRSPTNFFGVVTDEMLKELEEKMVEDMRKWYAEGCHPVYLAYGHYPLSTVGKEAHYFASLQEGLKRMLLKYGVMAWLCGHLHDAFGDHLHRPHRGDASTLLELETTDWKVKRRFRIMAIDEGQLSFMDFEMEKKSLPSVIRPLDAAVHVNGAVVLITAPASPYFAPLGNTAETTSLSTLRALVWPTDKSVRSEDLFAEARIYCGEHLSPIHTVERLEAVNGGPLFEAPIDQILLEKCDDRPVSVQVAVHIEGTDRISLSEKREIESRREPKPFPHAFMEDLVLRFPWCAVFQNLFTSMILAHIFLFLLLPKAISLKNSDSSRESLLDDASNGRRNGGWKIRIINLLRFPFLVFKTASQFPVFWWGQLCFALLMLFGPWFFARVLSDRPLGILFVPTIYIRPASSGFTAVYSPEMPFRSCHFCVTVVLPSTIWIVWTLQRWSDKSKHTGKRYKALLLIYILLGLSTLASFGHSVVLSGFYYGAFSVLLSPVYIGWIVLNAWTLCSARKSIAKCRQE